MKKPQTTGLSRLGRYGCAASSTSNQGLVVVDSPVGVLRPTRSPTARRPSSAPPGVVGPPLAVMRNASTGAGTKGTSAAKCLPVPHSQVLVHGRKLSPPAYRSLATGEQ